jgi:hypothetical protein
MDPLETASNLIKTNPLEAIKAFKSLIASGNKIYTFSVSGISRRQRQSA